jgi:hypothetical protein
LGNALKKPSECLLLCESSPDIYNINIDLGFIRILYLIIKLQKDQK